MVVRRTCHDSTKRLLQVMSKYAFVFAGENTACKDYVSEKYWSRFVIGLSYFLCKLLLKNGSSNESPFAEKNCHPF